MTGHHLRALPKCSVKICLSVITKIIHWKYLIGEWQFALWSGVLSWKQVYWCCAVEYKMFNFFDLLETTVVPSESLYLFSFLLDHFIWKNLTWRNTCFEKKNWRIINEHERNSQFTESVWLVITSEYFQSVVWKFAYRF